MTRSTTLRLIRLTAICLIIVLIVVYAIWRSFNYARGPRIQVLEPKNGEGIASSTVEIKGQALRVNNLTLNGDQVLIDQEGNFDETIIVFPGVNRLILAATDQFGRSTKTELDIAGLLPANSISQ